MVKDLIDAVSNALYANFEQVDIMSEGIEQGFEAPTFYIHLVDASEKRLLGDRAIRNVSLDVHYFPMSENEPKAEINVIASKLYGVLRRIDLLDGTSINGLNLHHEIEDDVLHFFVEYKPIVYYVGEKPDMQEEVTHELEIINE